MIKIGIAEDHTLLRTSLITLLNEFEQFQVSVEACNGEELLKRINPVNKPDIIFVDIEMPILDGPETVSALRSKYGDHIKLVGLSMHKEVRLITKMIDAGVNGFYSKSASPEELLDGITKVLNDEFYVSRDLVHLLPRLKQGALEKPLNQNEEEILKLICQEYTNHEISEKLGLALNTVNTYRTRIIDKLGVKNTAGLVLYAIKNGIHWLNE